MPACAAEGMAQDLKEKAGESGRKTRVAVLFGGRSVEHEISVISALQLMLAIDQDEFHITPVYITPAGKWYTGQELLQRKAYSNLAELESVCTEVTLLPKPGVSGLTVLKHKRDSLGVRTDKLSGNVIPIDVFLLAFHGEFGEDGCIQGLCELADIVYTGSSVPASALAMNKYLCKLCAEAAGVPVLPALQIDRVAAQRNIEGECARIIAAEGFSKFPLFVKPCNLGSSIGISRVDSAAALPAALARAFRYDSTALVERCVSKLLEINVSVREHPTEGAVASVVEVPVSSSGVLSYEDKYLRDGGKKGGSGGGMASLTRIIDPSDLSAEIKERARNYAVRIFKALDCSGVARLDFIMDLESNEIFFNELNPFPGSVSFYLWVKSEPRILFTELLRDMLRTAFLRKDRKDSLDHYVGLRALRDKK